MAIPHFLFQRGNSPIFSISQMGNSLLVEGEFFRNSPFMQKGIPHIFSIDFSKGNFPKVPREFPMNFNILLMGNSPFPSSATDWQGIPLLSKGNSQEFVGKSPLQLGNIPTRLMHLLTFLHVFHWWQMMFLNMIIQHICFPLVRFKCHTGVRYVTDLYV